MVVNFKP